MNKFKKDHIDNNPNKDKLSRKELYDSAQTAWSFFRFERDEARLLRDLLGRFVKLTNRIDQFMATNNDKLSDSMKEQLLASMNVRKDTSANLDEDVKKIFKLLNAAVMELNNNSKKEQSEEK